MSNLRGVLKFELDDLSPLGDIARESEPDQEYEPDLWDIEKSLVRENPMRHRDAVYLRMLEKIRADGEAILWTGGGVSPLVAEAKRYGFDYLDSRGKIKLLLRCINFGATKPGIYGQELYANAGDPEPTPHLDLEGDFWLPLTMLKDMISQGHPSRHEYQDDEQYKEHIADRMDGWSDIEQAWLGRRNSSDLCIFRPYNWVRYWIVNYGPPILVDPHYVMHMRGTPLAPPQKKQLFEVQKDGRRWWVSGGPTYDRREWLKGQGMKWDPVKKRWWTGKAEIADLVTAGVIEDTTPGSWEFYLEHESSNLGANQVLDRFSVDITSPFA